MIRKSLLLLPLLVLVGCGDGGTSAPEDKDFFAAQKAAMDKNPPNLSVHSKSEGMRKSGPKPGEKVEQPAAGGSSTGG